MATGTKLMKEISDQFLICQLCQEAFKEPKTLSCLHTFCCACLQNHYDEETSRPTRYTIYTRSLTCPLCRKKTDLPTGGVRRLPDNFLVSNLTEVLAKRCMAKVPPCEICHTVRPHSNDACSRCLDCDKLLCRSCVELHSSTKVTQEHSVIDVEGQKDIECKAHPEETVRFYCEKCEECICVVCTFQEHKDHDVCSFNDGFAKHKVTLEELLTKSKARLSDMGSRLKVIEKYETLSKDLKETIRDLAISYTSQVRAREKELIQQVDQTLSGEGPLRQLAESKVWLQETFDSLQSACQLTEIVMRDKGVEMLLLKKEIQGKMDVLLQTVLPPEPPDLPLMDVRFVPGEVKLGDVLVPTGEQQQEKEEGKKKEVKADGEGKVRMTNGTGTDVKPATSLPNCEATRENGGSSSGKPCTECVDRKRKEAEEARARHHPPHHHHHHLQHRRNSREGAEKTATRSVHSQTTAAPHESPADEGACRGNGHGTTMRPQESSGDQPPHANPVQAHGAAAAAAAAAAAGTNSRPPRSRQDNSGNRERAPQNGIRARGTMTERQDVRTLKTQTEESCLRDARLGQAAAMGSTYPNTGAAIAAAFLRHKASDNDVLSTTTTTTTNSKLSRTRSVEVDKQTQDAEVSTDISLSLSFVTPAQTLIALCGAEGGSSGRVQSPSGSHRPDLLAETGGSAASAAAASLATSSSSSVSSSSTSSSVKIRSRKIQTDISALLQTPPPHGSGDKFVSDSELRQSVCLTPGSANVPRPPCSRATTVTATPHHPSVKDFAHPLPPSTGAATKKDASVMTSFKVKVVPAVVDKATSSSSDEVTSHSVGMTTSPETRTLYIQTRGPRVVSTATGTDFEGQMSKSTSTLFVECRDEETSMPQVTHESRTTWTEAVVTSERATSTGSSSTSDAATLTTQMVTSDFAVQMRPIGVTASTNTSGPKTVHRPAQTTPSVASKATMPDPLLTATATAPQSSARTPQLVPKGASKSMSSASSSSSSSLSLLSFFSSPAVAAAPCQPRPLSMSSLPVVTTLGLPGPAAMADKATETPGRKLTTRAVGPNVRMLASRTASTDTLSLLQVTDKETATPTVRTVDDWTHTPQPQMISTGVTPPRPAVLEVGVATVPITLMDQATYTEVKTCRELGVETCLVVCDSETLTERTLTCDAQTEVEGVSMQNEGTTTNTTTIMAGEDVGDGTTSTTTEPAAQLGPLPSPCGRDVKDGESQCQSLELVSKEVNTTWHRRRAKEVQTCYSYTECLLCRHPDKLQQLGLNSKTFTDTSTDPTPPDTHDVATMALGGQPPSSPGLTHAGVQTSSAVLYDKSAATSFDLEEESAARPFLAMESQDAATSTDSLPYIGLLSEIDVDELIVIPEANFELVSDSDFDDICVPMVDGETLTEILDYAEVGTQTLQPVPAGGDDASSSEHNPPEIRHEDDISKHHSSIGVNTLPKVTFEKETSTPAHHLFSKGTMTFFVTKMDKATSTISCLPRFKTDGGSGQTGGGSGDSRAARDSGRQKQVDNKVTMTNRTEQRDIAVETDPALVDGRITECISKLRNVSERLNSPTTRKNSDSETASEPSAPPQKQNEGLHPPVSAKPPPSPKIHRKETWPAPGLEIAAEDPKRQRQLQRFVVDTGVVLKPKDPSPVRKAQPITTLKPRIPVTPGDMSGYSSRSLPRQGSLERQNRVKMGSQVTPATSKLPLLRYNSAPGRIATVPTHTLLMRSGATSPGGTSPSKIPVSQKPASPTPGSVPSSESGPEPDTVSTSSSQKVQQRPSLPSITETNTPSSCSDSSFPSLDTEEAFISVHTAPCHSRSPSDVHPLSELLIHDAVKTTTTADADCGAAVEGDGDDSSVSSASAVVAVTAPAQAVSSSSESLSKQKKEKKGFMQRLLSVKKKKKDNSSSSSSSEKDGSKPDAAADSRPQKQQAPPSPQIAKKQPAGKPAAPAQGAKSKATQKPAPAASSSQAAAATTAGATAAATAVRKPSSPISTPASSRPSSSTDPAQQLSAPRTEGTSASAAAVPPSSPPLPPHHYPPPPDPSKSPPAPKKPRPFVYVRQRIFSIQQDNVEEVMEKKEKEKEDQEPKGKAPEKLGTQVTAAGTTKVKKDPPKLTAKAQAKEKAKSTSSDKLAAAAAAAAVVAVASAARKEKRATETQKGLTKEKESRTTSKIVAVEKAKAATRVVQKADNSKGVEKPADKGKKMTRKLRDGLDGDSSDSGTDTQTDQ